VPDSFSTEERCQLSIPGFHLWHVDLIAREGGVEGLVAAFPEGTDPSRCSLFYVSSDNGLEFHAPAAVPLLRPSMLGWDNRMIYRSSLGRLPDGTYLMAYSAASWGLHCGIAILRGELDALEPVQGGKVENRIFGVRPDDLAGMGKYLIRKWTPKSVLRIIRPGILGVAESRR
jgi:hypothetical protein